MRYKNIFTGKKVTVTKEGFNTEMQEIVEYTKDEATPSERTNKGASTDPGLLNFVKLKYVFHRCHIAIYEI